MPLLLWILLLILGVYALLILPRLPRRAMDSLLGWDYAHRGLWNDQRPENSLSAFRAAAEQGFGIELDVHLTADGRLAVHHDDSLQRMCGADMIISRTELAQLRDCRLLNTQEKIPTLDEALEAVGGRVPLIVELKVEGNHEALSSAVWERMRRYGGAWCMESFDPRAVQWFRRHAPEVIRGQLAYDHAGRGKGWRDWLRQAGIASLLQNALSRPDFVAFEAQSEKWHSFPMIWMRLIRPWLAAWTIRSQEEMDSLRGRYDLQIFEGFVPNGESGRKTRPSGRSFC